MVTDTIMVSIEVKQETNPWAISIGTVTFDLG